jgi:hypothetical protein
MLDTRYNVNGLEDLANTNMVYIKHLSAVLAVFVSNIA